MHVNAYYSVFNVTQNHSVYKVNRMTELTICSWKDSVKLKQWYFYSENFFRIMKVWNFLCVCWAVFYSIYLQ